MSRRRRGPGINWELKYKHPAAELYEQGWTAYRIAYAFGDDVHSIRGKLRDVLDEDAESQSERNLVRKARGPSPPARTEGACAMMPRSEGQASSSWLLPSALSTAWRG